MISDSPKPVNFPLILPQKENKKKWTVPVYAYVIIGLVVLLLIIILLADIEYVGVFLFALINILIMLSRFFEPETKPVEVKYLKDKNRIRFDSNGIIITINEEKCVYDLAEMSDICVFYRSYARERFTDEVFTGSGLDNSVSFKYKGTPFKYQFYLDNKTWVILFDRVLFNWAFNGTKVNIYNKGRNTHSLGT